MKQNLHSFAVSLLFLLLIVSAESIRPLSTKQPTTSISQLGEEMKVTNGVVHAEDDTSINELMGMEVCENGDEECIERRMASEAHLDYIYTQHHKP